MNTTLIQQEVNSMIDEMIELEFQQARARETCLVAWATVVITLMSSLMMLLMA